MAAPASSTRLAVNSGPCSHGYARSLARSGVLPGSTDRNGPGQQPKATMVDLPFDRVDHPHL